MYIQLYIQTRRQCIVEFRYRGVNTRRRAGYSTERTGSRIIGMPTASDATRYLKMSKDNFEWDDAKRADNIKKHRIDFNDVPSLFDGPFLLRSSVRRGEHRLAAIGLLNGREVTVVFTTRSTKRRIISARRARNDEREALKDAFHRLQSKPQPD